MTEQRVVANMNSTVDRKDHIYTNDLNSTDLNSMTRVSTEEAEDPSSPTSNINSPPRSDGSNGESDTDHLSKSASPAANKKIQTFKRGAWSPQEDERLVQLVETMRPLKWVYVAQEMQTRSSKQCRERYHNYLKPSLTKTLISKDEGRKIEDLVSIYGKRWAEISRQLPGRSDNAIKNWWNANANRRRNSQDQIIPAASANINGRSGSVGSVISPVSNENKTSSAVKLSSPVPHKQGNTKPTPHNGSVASSGSSSSHDGYNGIQQLLTAGQSALSPPIQHQVISSSPNHQAQWSAAPQQSPIKPESTSSQMTDDHSSHQASTSRAAIDQYHYPPPIQVAFSGMYAEPSSQHTHSSSTHTHNHHMPSHHTSYSPYPLTPNHRAESRANSLARASLGDIRRSSSIIDVKPSSPNASPPTTPRLLNTPAYSFMGSYSHLPPSNVGDDPATLFDRIRKNSEIRRTSNVGVVDATSLSHYSLGSQANVHSAERANSVNPPTVAAELATPPPGLITQNTSSGSTESFVAPNSNQSVEKPSLLNVKSQHRSNSQLSISRLTN